MTPQQESIVFKGIASEILAMSCPREKSVAGLLHSFGYSLNKLVDVQKITEVLVMRGILERHGSWVSAKPNGSESIRVGQYVDGVFEIHNKTLWSNAFIQLL